MKDDLIARLEAGDGADRELDGAIYSVLLLARPGCVAMNPPAYTSSLDAAIALVEKMLPGVRWTVHSATPEANASAVLRPWVGEHATDASRAILIALLRSQESSP